MGRRTPSLQARTSSNRTPSVLKGAISAASLAELHRFHLVDRERAQEHQIWWTVYDSYIVKRTQIYLDDRQDDDLARRAAAEGVTKSALIRRAVDELSACAFECVPVW